MDLHDPIPSHSALQEFPPWDNNNKKSLIHVTPGWLLWPLWAGKATQRLWFFVFVFLIARRAPSARLQFSHAIQGIPEISKPDWSRLVINEYGNWPPSVLPRCCLVGSTRKRINRMGQSHAVAQMQGDLCFLSVCLSIYLTLSVSSSVSEGKAQSTAQGRWQRQSTCNILWQQTEFIAWRRARSPCSCK